MISQTIAHLIIKQYKHINKIIILFDLGYSQATETFNGATNNEDDEILNSYLEKANFDKNLVIIRTKSMDFFNNSRLKEYEAQIKKLEQEILISQQSATNLRVIIKKQSDKKELYSKLMNQQENLRQNNFKRLNQATKNIYLKTNTISNLKKQIDKLSPKIFFKNEI